MSRGGKKGLIEEERGDVINYSGPTEKDWKGGESHNLDQ